MVYVGSRESEVGEKVVVLVGQGCDRTPVLDRPVELLRTQPEEAEWYIGLLRPAARGVGG